METLTAWDKNILNYELIGDIYDIGFPRIMVDIGAHIGGTCRLALDRGAEVYAYEPSKRNFELLKKNAPEAHLFNVGVGKKGKRKLYLHHYNTGCYSVNPDNTKDMSEEYEEVEFIDIKDVFKDLEYCDFLKIDCEGGEAEFYQDIPVNKVRRMAIELHGIKEKEILEFLGKYYQIEQRNDVYLCR